MKSPKEVIGSVGVCIYCGAAEGQLSDEHIVPLGLGGIWVLRKASCPNCQNITSAIELDVLRYTLLQARAKLGLPSRHDRQMPGELPLIVAGKGRQHTILVPVEKHPTILFLPRFKPPAYIDKRHYKAGIDVEGVYIYQLGCFSPQDFAKKSSLDSLTYTCTFKSYKGGFSFARLLAKIAYGFAVAKFGSGVINNSWVTSSILGKSDDIGKWVGCVGESSDTSNKLHIVKLETEKEKIYVRITLFAMLRGLVPEYLVVVGKAPTDQ